MTGTKCNVFSLVAIMVALTFLPRFAHAEDKLACRVLEIRASNDAGGIDAELKPLAGKLKKPPFSAWKRFALVRAHDLSVVRMTAVDVALSQGGKLSLLFRERSGDSGKARLRLTLTLDNKAGKRVLTSTISLDAGDYSLIGNEAQSDGATNLIALTCKA